METVIASARSRPSVRSAQPLALANWLFVVAAMVFAMVVVGGITRLTESGLSITEWQPIAGVIPPLTDAQWQAAFDAYKQVPQFAAIHSQMTLGDFQTIFLWEYGHRLLGRVLGLAFAVPLLWFGVRRAIPAGYTPRLLALLALGGLQGAVGWWMVESGLFSGVAVSHFRLAVHLMMALTLMGGLIWTALDLRMLARAEGAGSARLKPFAIAVLATLAVQIMLGAWTSGMRAGAVANTWPLMNEHFIPEGIDWSRGAGWALSSDPFLVHFMHRWWAWGAAIALFILARAARKAGVRSASVAIHSAVGTQILLGIATVVSGIALPLAVLHQAVGAIVVASAAWGAHVIGRKRT